MTVSLHAFEPIQKCPYVSTVLLSFKLEKKLIIVKSDTFLEVPYSRGLHFDLDQVITYKLLASYPAVHQKSFYSFTLFGKESNHERSDDNQDSAEYSYQ